MNMQSILLTMVFIIAVVAIVGGSVTWFVRKQKREAKMTSDATITLDEYLVKTGKKYYSLVIGSQIVGAEVHFRVKVQGQPFLYIVDSDKNVRTDIWKVS